MKTTTTQTMTQEEKEETPWWTGVPTTLIRKTTLVAAADHRLPVYTLTFSIPTDDAAFTAPAQPHSKMRLDMGDVVKMVIPNYKPKSYSISELRREEFDVTLKVYPNGRASGFLDRLQVGDSIYSFGKHAARTRNPGSYVGVVAYGVGITEGLPVAEAELEKGTPMVKLLWASRTMADTFWHDKIEKVQEQYGDRFEFQYILSRETKEGCLQGRINPTVLESVFVPEDREHARFISVGTKEMMRMTDAMFAEIGYPMPQYHLLPKNKKK